MACVPTGNVSAGRPAGISPTVFTPCMHAHPASRSYVGTSPPLCRRDGHLLALRRHERVAARLPWRDPVPDARDGRRDVHARWHAVRPWRAWRERRRLLVCLLVLLSLEGVNMKVRYSKIALTSLQSHYNCHTCAACFPNIRCDSRVHSLNALDSVLALVMVLNDSATSAWQSQTRQ